MARGKTRESRSGEKTVIQGAITGYEAELWRMADTLRGSMDAAEYKHVVLGLIFLKYISDAFALVSVIAAQTHHAEASAIPLLGMRFALQDVAYRLAALRTDGASPVDETARCPRQMLLVRFGAVGWIGSKAMAGPAARMSGDAAALVEDLHGAGRQAHLHLLLGKGVRDRVAMPVDLDVVVDVDLGLSPRAQLVAVGG